MNDLKFDELKIAVLCGADGAEREISLQSGACIAEALCKSGAEVIEHDFQIDDTSIFEDKSIDLYFLAFHGEFGEGGDMQQICEDRGLVYTGSGPRASLDAFDKIISKRKFNAAGIDNPRCVYIEKKKDLLSVGRKLGDKKGKFVVKPACQGSSIGVTIVDSVDAAVETAKECFAEFGSTLIEMFVDGREFAVSIVDGQVLPIIEIKISNHDFYDYDAKYDDDSTEYIFDSIADKGVIAKMNMLAIKSFEVLDCSDFGRVDFMMDSSGKIYVLEVNTIPGFTSHSLLPKAAAKAGMDMTALCMKIVAAAMSF